MELIVRTAHGTADVSVDLLDTAVPLRDVVAAVTGQAAAGTAQVDGHLVNANNTIEACGVVAGSILDTMLDNPTDAANPPVTMLRQLTGPGAGRGVPLSTGRYRIGPGRRQQSDELAADTTDVTAFELEVSPTGKSGEPKVTVTPNPQSMWPLALGPESVQRSSPWRGEPLASGGRLFRLEPFAGPNSPTASAHSWAQATAGFLVHNRPPGVVGHDRTIAGAIDDAMSRAPRLWHHRLAAGPMLVDVGVVPTKVGAYDADQSGLQPISVDLADDRVISVAGDAEDRDALARAMVLDLATRYGPADVDIVVATTPEALGNWDWIKWLPHARRGASVGLLTNDLEMASLSDGALERSTLFLVTDDMLWNSEASPLRSFVLNPPKNAAVVVLTAGRTSAPTSATILVDVDSARPGHATLVRMALDVVELELFVPLLDADTTTNAARRLAPLIDPDRAGLNAHHAVPAVLEEIIRLDEVPQRWNTSLGAPGNPVEMGIGRRSGEAVSIDLSIDSGVIVTGSSLTEAVDVANVVVLSSAAAWSPIETSVLVVDHRPTSGRKPLSELPHHVGTFTERDRSSVDVLLERLRMELTGDRPSSSRLMIAISGVAETELAAPGLVDRLVDLASDSVGVHLVIATARPLAVLPAELHAVCPIEIAIDRYGGVRRATVSDQRRTRRTGFTPYDDTASPNAPINVRPFVFGRQPSALERQLERAEHKRPDSLDDPTMRAAQRLAQFALDLDVPLPSPLLPTPLPARVLASRLWAKYDGDGIPLGLRDSATSDGQEPYWWQPGADGSRVFIGTPRSGVRTAFDVLLMGVDRFSSDDLEVHAVEPHDRRRIQIAQLPHVRRVESPADHAAIEAMLGGIESTMDERLDSDDFRLHDHRSILVMLRDVDRISEEAISQLGRIMSNGSGVGINVVAVATRPGQVQPLLKACQHVVVGALSDPEHYEQLGIERSSSVDSHVGRAQIIDGPLIQLAALDATFDHALTELLALNQSGNQRSNRVGRGAVSPFAGGGWSR